MHSNTPIHSITKFTTLDYPHHLASILWFAKCNMACSYCYNPQIVNGQGNHSIGEVLSFLEKRKGFLDGVVLSGGECTLYPHLIDFCISIKELGYKIKIDTNGTNPLVLNQLLEKNLLDYVALDYKAPKNAYASLTHYKHFERISQSLDILLATPDIAFEARTTWHSDLLSINDINEIIEDLFKRGYKGTYYLQRYLHVSDTLGQTKEEQTKVSISELSSLLPIELRNF